MSRILQINVLAAFHNSKPAIMPPLYRWPKGQSYITLARGAQAFLKSQGTALETLANYHWLSAKERGAHR